MTKLSSRYFIELTQPEIAKQLQDNPLVILPAGSVEQHGPHLPTGTDIYAANVISHAVAERMNGLVLPGGPLGVTPMHMPFEGTITLTPETFMKKAQGCEISDSKSNDGSMSWKMTCPHHGGQLLGKAAFKSSGKRVDGTVKLTMNFNGQEMSFKQAWKGKYVGDCE